MNFTEIGITLLIILLVLYLFSNKKKSTPTIDGQIIIWGQPNSQKTRLYFKLLMNRIVETTTTCERNQESFEFANQNLTLIDLGGHSKFERELLSLLRQNSPLVYLIDSSDKFDKQKEHLRLCERHL